jgi:thymidine kinase
MSINLYIGCMYSGKTSLLIREYKRWEKIGKSVLCINYAKDDRYGNDDFMYSHNTEKAKCIKVINLSDVPKNLLNSSDIIIINEGQFFSDLINFCTEWCDLYSKNIIVCGLDGDFQRKPIGQINELISLCDDVEKLKALCDICRDGTPALFSWRNTNDRQQIVIGNNYIPVCRKHYLQLQKNKDLIIPGALRNLMNE